MAFKRWEKANLIWEWRGKEPQQNLADVLGIHRTGISKKFSGKLKKDLTFDECEALCEHWQIKAKVMDFWNAETSEQLRKVNQGVHQQMPISLTSARELLAQIEQDLLHQVTEKDKGIFSNAAQIMIDIIERTLPK